MDTSNLSLDQLISIVSQRAMQEMHQGSNFVPGVTKIPVSGKVFDEKEISNAIHASVEFWLTAGETTALFERALSKIFGVRSASMCNSGSSANLIAVSALTSPSLGDRALKPGDEVITVAAGFPTTVAPIIQNGLIPVFVDVDLETLSPNLEEIRLAISERTKAIIFAHALGNPFDIKGVLTIAREHDLWLIEDCCDALGATYEGKHVGSFGDISTVSFYPAHHITTGEGGAVLTKHARLKPIIESFRDWGRDCWCLPGCDNTCAKRYEWDFPDLPTGYDHKYVYSHIGYNLKSGEIQAAIGLAQLEKLQEFIELRRANWRFLYDGLSHLSEFLILPKATEDSDPSWFGFALTVRDQGTQSRNDLIEYLDGLGIQTRLFFAGNLTKQPGFRDIPSRSVSELRTTNRVMESTFWLGVWPGLTQEMLSFVVSSINTFFTDSRFIK
jgi:CDP-6-deoxy-D-xylo-4-hexulose-3-dehydrase